MSADEIVPGLWVSDYATVSQGEFLQEKQIRVRGEAIKSDTIKTLQVPVDDDERENLMEWLERCIEFIDEHLQRNEGVLVHCQAGVSRSSTIVAGYIMKKTGATPESAVETIQRKRSVAQPASYFMDQLQMWQECDYTWDPQRYKVERRYLMSRMAEEQRNGQPGVFIVSQLGGASNADGPSRGEGSSAEGSSAEGSSAEGSSAQVQVHEIATSSKPLETRLRCKMCRRDLAGSEHVLFHEPQGGRSDAFAWNKHDSQQKTAPTAVTGTNEILARLRGAPVPPQTADGSGAAAAQSKALPKSLLSSPQCTVYFVEPMSWMSETLGEGELHGRLLCPNERCRAKLGAYDWAGQQCSCSAWVCPAFALQASKVDTALTRNKAP